LSTNLTQTAYFFLDDQCSFLSTWLSHLVNASFQRTFDPQFHQQSPLTQSIDCSIGLVVMNEAKSVSLNDMKHKLIAHLNLFLTPVITRMKQILHELKSHISVPTDSISHWKNVEMMKELIFCKENYSIVNSEVVSSADTMEPFQTADRKAHVLRARLVALHNKMGLMHADLDHFPLCNHREVDKPTWIVDKPMFWKMAFDHPDLNEEHMEAIDQSLSHALLTKEFLENLFSHC